MADTATLQARLEEAELTLHKLRTGQLEREMRDGGMGVAFRMPKEQELLNAINDLRSELGLPLKHRHHSRGVRF